MLMMRTGKAEVCFTANRLENMASERKQSKLMPTFDEEARLWTAGYQRIAGLDEAGRGALAGPVVAAAVVAPAGSKLEGIWAEVRDSKLLSPAARSALIQPIQEAAVAWGVGVVHAQTIDEIGIAAATRQAMIHALEALCVAPDYLLIDWVKLPQINLPQKCVPKADQRMASVAAASILAKVTRDSLLVEMGALYPRYGFGDHKGYGTVKHLSSLAAHGPCVEHRHSFAPIAPRAMLWDEKIQVEL
jgi:ribonuclease HII